MTATDKQALVDMIEARLQRDFDAIQQSFRHPAPAILTRACSIPSLLPEEVAQQIFRAFPPPAQMRRMSSLRERKYTFKQLRECAPIVESVTFAFQDLRILRLVERLTGMPELLPDAHLYAGGISSMVRGDFLNPHIDNSHDSQRNLYRRINLLYYVTPDWAPENGGNLNLWDDTVSESVTFASAFNCLVLMETNRHSWHSVNRVIGAGPRCCVSNYYFSEKSPDGTQYFHITDFSAPPEQPVRRLVARIDGRLRTAVRYVKHRGFSREDFYK